MFDLLQTDEPDPVVEELPLPGCADQLPVTSDRRSHERPHAAELERRAA
jgi:hypothetical protein